MTRCTFGDQRPQSIKTIAQHPSLYDSFGTMTDLSNVTHLLFDHDGVDDLHVAENGGAEFAHHVKQAVLDRNEIEMR